MNASSPSSSSPEDILSLLIDKPSLTILKLLDGKEYSIQQIASTLDLPVSSTYRKVNKLEQLKMIKKTKIVRKTDGTDESFYTSWIDEIQITLKNNIITCKVKNKDYQDKIVRLWQGFKHKHN
ncbi:MAG TPA: helix-turn-helix domain-containing protein [Candidatus Nitrosocosmicus sp.]|nr:helix-turn-helix domain-containing protein [Candidatus Nitrosocosmicus sp.]